jgi:hypothetical protein
MVTRLVTTNADQGGSKKPLTFWSEDELNAEIEQRIVEAAGLPRGLTVEHPRLEVETPSAPETTS